MPIYEYACPDCGHKFDAIQKFSDDPITVCPKCEAGSVKKLISATSFILKGGGWYKDHYGLKPSGDSKGEGSKSEGSKSEGSKSEGSKSEGGSKESAPASSPAPASAPSAPSSGSSTPGST